VKPVLLVVDAGLLLCSQFLVNQRE